MRTYRVGVRIGKHTITYMIPVTEENLVNDDYRLAAMLIAEDRVMDLYNVNDPVSYNRIRLGLEITEAKEIVYE